MISQSADYSLRAVVCLAKRAGRPLTIRQIADAIRAPAGYLAKSLGLLSRAGLVSAQRGLNGGYSLARDPRRIMLLEIVQVADPSRRIAACPLGMDGEGDGGLCALHRRIDEAAASAEAVLAGRTVAEILEEAAGRAGLCEEGGTAKRRCQTCSK